MKTTSLCILILAVSIASGIDPIGCPVRAQVKQKSVKPLLGVCPSNPYPANGATCIRWTGLTLKWSYSTLPAPTGYQLYFGTISNPPLIQRVSSWATSLQQPTDLTLKANTKYYWRIVPMPTSLAAASCPVWSFTTGRLDCATSPNPSVGSTGVPTTPQLTWTYSGLGGCTPTGYEIYLDTISTPKLVSVTAGKTFASGELMPGTTYYWRIVPYNAFTRAIESPVWSFTTLTPCITPPANPVDGATCVTLSPAIGIGVGLKKGTTSVKFYFGTSSDPPLIKTYLRDPYWAPSGIPTYVAPPTVLSPATKYYWKSVPTSNAVEATGCPVWSFTTGPLGCAINPSPANGARGVSSNPTLSWASSGPTGCELLGYRICFGPTSNPSLVAWAQVSTYSPGKLIPGTTYYWQVIPYNNEMSAGQCPVWSFTVGNQ